MLYEFRFIGGGGAGFLVLDGGGGGGAFFIPPPFRTPIVCCLTGCASSSVCDAGLYGMRPMVDVWSLVEARERRPTLSGE